MAMANASNTTAPTQFIQSKLEKYAHRRFGKGNGLPLLCLQHFTGTLDNWDPAVTDPLALAARGKSRPNDDPAVGVWRSAQVR